MTNRACTSLRPLYEVRLGSGITLALKDSVKDVRERLAAEVEKRAVGGDDHLRRLRYPAHGVDLVVTDRVLAICLCGAKAPVLPLPGRGGLGPASITLRVGMTVQELDRALADYADCLDSNQFDVPGVWYRYYPALGLVVKYPMYDPDGKVEELIVVQLPAPRRLSSN